MHDRLLEEPGEMETIVFEPSVYDPVLCETRKLTQHEFDEIVRRSKEWWSCELNGRFYSQWLFQPPPAPTESE